MDETAAAGRQEQTGGFCASSPYKKDETREGRQRKRGPSVTEEGDEAHRTGQTEHGQLLNVKLGTYVPPQLGVEARPAGEHGEGDDRREIDPLSSAPAHRSQSAQACTARVRRKRLT